jgi:uncharacterized protein (TIGR02145 family)
MNKLYIVAGLLMGFLSMQAQYTEMTIHETGGGVISYSINDVDSITYETLVCPATITDARDGEIYAVVQIEGQCWLAENLRYDVPGVYGAGDTMLVGAPSVYGRLYRWSTLMNGSSSSTSNPSGVPGICPSGWHLPSDAEWNEMELALGMSSANTTAIGYRGTHGTDMKSMTDWNSGNGTNASGFNGFPVGAYTTTFVNGGDYGYFWTATAYTSNSSWFRYLNSGNAGVRRDKGSANTGRSCRCVQD